MDHQPKTDLEFASDAVLSKSCIDLPKSKGDNPPVSNVSDSSLKGINVRWSKTARELVRANKDACGARLSALITQLTQESGNSRRACWRFVRRSGIQTKRPQRTWTEAEKNRLLELIESRPVQEIARLLRRSADSIWHMLRRLGASARLGKDGFTKYQLATALHVRPDRIQYWIDQGWLVVHQAREGHGHGFIRAEDFCRFCKKYSREVIGRRLSIDRLEFVRLYVFPPSHAELLPVRESKKERLAYQSQLEEAEDGEDAQPMKFGPDRVDDDGDSLEDIA